MQKDLNYTIEILEIEKLKLLEQIDYLDQHIAQLTNEYSDKILEKDEEMVRLSIKMQQVEKVNQDLLQKLSFTKKNEEQLNNANYNFIAIQKKLDVSLQENQKLESKVKLLNEQSQQFQQKWQRVSLQLKQVTTSRVSIKALEQQLTLKQDECTSLKEKLVQAQLELMVIKQSENEYKLSVQQKMTALCSELQEQQQKLLETTYVQQECLKCEELRNQMEQIKSQQEIYNSENIFISSSYQTIQTLQNQIKEQYNKILELELENTNIKKQLQQSDAISNIRISGTSQSRIIQQHPLFLKMTKLIDQMKEPIQQELFKKSLNDLGHEIQQRENKEQQLQEQKTMYDRLLLKYYALQKTISKLEEDHQQPPINNSKQQTLQKKPYQMDSFLQEQETTKQMKKLQAFSNTPKQRVTNKLNLSLDSCQFKQ